MDYTAYIIVRRFAAVIGIDYHKSLAESPDPSWFAASDQTREPAWPKAAD
jgi:hypothetical protein